MSEQKKYSVVICTWNRAKDLERVLNNFVLASRNTNESWELCIVDNNSSDNTRTIVESFFAKLPMRYVFEGKQGLSNARNTGLFEALGEWIIFTDDDVEIHELWLKNYFLELQKLSDNIAFVGGEVIPKFLGEPNKDMLEAIPIIAAGYCGIKLPQNKVIDKDSLNIPFGANFAINKQSVGNLKFDGKLGVSGKTRLAGEESIFMRELVKQGLSGRWLENISLTHFVPVERLTDEYVKNYLFGKGRTSVLLSENKTSQVELWMFREVLELILKKIWLKCTFRYTDIEKYKIMMVLYQRLGFIYQSLFLKK